MIVTYHSTRCYSYIRKLELRPQHGFRATAYSDRECDLEILASTSLLVHSYADTLLSKPKSSIQTRSPSACKNPKTKRVQLMNKRKLYSVKYNQGKLVCFSVIATPTSIFDHVYINLSPHFRDFSV